MLHRLAEVKGYLSQTLQSLLPVICGVNGSYHEECKPSGVCDFPAVHCVEVEGVAVPTSLILSCAEWTEKGFNITRQRLPAQLWNVTFLITLSFEDCPFNGPLPREIANLRLLEELKMRNTSLGGQIPMQIGELSHLSLLSLDHANLNGEIPWKLRNLEHLFELSLEGNALSGQLPAWLWFLDDLVHLDLSHNQFSGELSDDVGRLKKNLAFLDLNTNYLSGFIPKTVSDLEGLTWLDLGHNRFEGDVPRAFEFLQSLQMLDISGNWLDGEIPKEFGRLQKCDTLIMSDNRLTGAIPEEICSMSSLFWLDLNFNSLDGVIPNEIGRLKHLEYLSLDHNNIEGTIPLSIVELTKLQYLGLSRNRLKGTIPWGIGSMHNLLVVNLAQNYLTGPIPYTFGNLRKLVGLFLFRNDLSGRIPSSLSNLKDLAYLALHENALYDEVPPMQLTPCKIEGCKETILVTLYGNHLSCRLPELIAMDDKNVLRAAVAHGNKFSLEPDGTVPTWLPNEAKDRVHFRKYLFLKTRYTLLVGGAMFTLLYVLVLRLDFFRFLREDVIVMWWNLKEPEAKGHAELLAFLLLMTLMACFMTPVYILGSGFTECGDRLNHYSLTYLARSPYSEAVIVVCLVVHLLLVYAYIEHLPQDPVRPGMRNILSKGVRYFTWLLVMFFAALPSGSYAAMKVLPEDNYFSHWWGKYWYRKFFEGAPATSAVMQAIVVPSLAAIFSKRMGVPVRQLLTTTHFVCFWLAPVLAVVYMGEGCGKRWRWFWSECQPYGSSDYLEAEFHFPDAFQPIKVMDKQSTCYYPPISRTILERHKGGCSRDILEAVTPLLLQALVLEAVIFPAITILTWVLSKRSEDRQELQLRGLGVRVSFTVEEYFLQLDIWASTATLWGPMVPALQALLLLVVSVSYSICRLETRYFGCREALEEGDVTDEDVSKKEEVNGTGQEADNASKEDSDGSKEKEDSVEKQETDRMKRDIAKGEQRVRWTVTLGSNNQPDNVVSVDSGRGRRTTWSGGPRVADDMVSPPQRLYSQSYKDFKESPHISRDTLRLAAVWNLIFCVFFMTEMWYFGEATADEHEHPRAFGV